MFTELSLRKGRRETERKLSAYGMTSFKSRSESKGLIWKLSIREVYVRAFD